VHKTQIGLRILGRAAKEEVGATEEVLRLRAAREEVRELRSALEQVLQLRAALEVPMWRLAPLPKETRM